MKKYILTLDQGTTSSRAILFNHEGKIVSLAQREFTQFYPKPGWVEHDPMEIWSTQASVITEAILKENLKAEEIAAIGITNQRETTVVWDRETGIPVYNAIVWQDRRTSEYCDQLKQKKLDKLIQQKTGLVLDAYFSATKVQWILNNVEGARKKAEEGKLAFGTIDSWLIWNLTEGKLHITDVSNASRTMLFNINTLEWDEELLKLFEVPKSMLPQVRSSSELYGETSGKLLGTKVPIAGIAGDQQAALFGHICNKPGMVKNTYGTGCFLLQHIGDRFVLSENRLITTLACSLNRKLEYALEGSIFIGGAVVQWLRDNLGIIRKSSDVEALAASVSDNGGIVFVPAFVGLGAPHWDSYARGLLIGLERGTRPGHIARAALESIAFQVADVMEAMDRETQNPFRELRVDGGAATNDLLMQCQADILGIPVSRPQQVETTALGAAYLAGLATGFWESPQHIQRMRSEGKRFTPIPDRRRAEQQRERWREAVTRARGWNHPGNTAPLAAKKGSA